jgi:hypothetical protein
MGQGCVTPPCLTLALDEVEWSEADFGEIFHMQVNVICEID